MRKLDGVTFIGLYEVDQLAQEQQDMFLVKANVGAAGNTILLIAVPPDSQCRPTENTRDLPRGSVVMELHPEQARGLADQLASPASPYPAAHAEEIARRLREHAALVDAAEAD